MIPCRTSSDNIFQSSPKKYTIINILYPDSENVDLDKLDEDFFEGIQFKRSKK